MFKNYLLTAWRNIIRHKLYAFINIGGLAVGLAACILIFLFVRDEYSFDKHYSDGERIYRIEGIIHINGRDPFPTVASQGVLAPTLIEDFPQIERATRLDLNHEPVVLDNQRYFQDVVAVDENFFSLFDLEFVEGNAGAALTQLSSLVISEDMARKYFGDQSALGKTLTVNNDKELQITGVIKNLPTNTHLKFDMIRRINPADFGDSFLDWRSSSFLTYIKMREGQGIETVLAGIDDFSDRHIPADLVARLADSGHDLFGYIPIALHDIHFRSLESDEMRPMGDLKTVYGFIVIAILILGIAVINFINLSTARFAARTKEVAVRKVVGASRKQLVIQFLIESTGVVIFAFLLALALVEIFAPWLSNFFQQVNLLGASGDPLFLIGIGALVIVVGLGSGIYPSMYMSSIRPGRSLGASKSTDGGSFRLRSILVIFQFAISITLIIATGVISAQLNFVRNLDLGFDTANTLVIRNIDLPFVAPSMEPFMNSLKAHPDVVSLSRSNGVPGDDEIIISDVTYPGYVSDQPLLIRYRDLDFDYLSAYGIKPLAGRIFDPAFVSDAVALEGDEQNRSTPSAVINLSAVRFFEFGSPEEAIGKTFTTGPNDETPTQWTVIGVIPDMHVDSLKIPIEPMFYDVNLANVFTLSVHFETEDLGTFLREVDDIWNRHVLGVPITRDFLDDNLAALYAEEEVRSSILVSFSILAIMVSALGLFGLASFSAEQRTREIGIRKVMGASSMDIIRLMVWQFSKPVILANLIAWPAAWYFINDWLTGFAYRIDLSPLYFIGAAMLAVFIAWFTVGSHAYLAARNHPSNALRYE